MKIFLNEDFINLRNFLFKYTGKAYFVGGFSRDIFLKKECFDIDIEVYDILPLKFDEIMKNFGATGVGKNYFVYKYKNFDLSLPRTENKVGIGHKAFEVKLCNDEKLAVKRRDFTMNSIMINIFTGEILDFYNGIGDIENKILRMVCKKTFIEDSLRVLRAIQFAARFGFEVEYKTFETMKTMKLNDLSTDRIRCELIKLFNAEFQGIGLRLIYELKLFEFLFLKDVSKKKCYAMADFINEARKYIKNEMLFLYIVSNCIDVDKKALLKRLNLSSSYKRLESEAFYKKATDENLLEVAIKMPLKNWLGLYSKDRILRAKKLGVYEHKFDTGVKSEDVLKDGFVGAEIGVEISRRQKLAIKKHLFI